MNRQIEFDNEARQKLVSGVKKLYNAVSSTLGARGGHVIFNEGASHAVTKDGVTVAKQISLDDPIEQAAVSIVREAALRTARDAGDGTTTATVLAYHIIREAVANITSGANGMEIKRGIDLAVEQAIEYVKKSAIEVSGKNDIISIARISANNDQTIGNLIGDIFEKVGKNGSVRLEHTQSTKTKTDVVEGCQLNSGSISPNFFNVTSKRIAEYKDPLILITDKAFTEGFDQVEKALVLSIEAKKPLLIICGEMEGETLGTLAINRLKHKLEVVAIKSPEFGKDRIDLLEDLAAMTGGKFISEANGDKISDMTINDFGSADRIVVSENMTTIIGRHGDSKDIDERVDSIQTQQENDKHNQQTFRLENRIAMLTGGVGVIYVGGNSEVEMKETYYRLEDALSAAKSALAGGIVTGGGVAYHNIAKYGIARSGYGVDKDFDTGVDILMNALSAPLKKIALNAGENGDVVVDKIDRRDGKDPVLGRYGYDSLNLRYCDLISEGIVDPANVVITAIKNAASVAGMLITTNCVIVDKKE